jgi:hypothetical protein
MADHRIVERDRVEETQVEPGRRSPHSSSGKVGYEAIVESSGVVARIHRRAATAFVGASIPTAAEGGIPVGDAGRVESEPGGGGEAESELHDPTVRALRVTVCKHYQHSIRDQRGEEGAVDLLVENNVGEWAGARDAPVIHQALGRGTAGETELEGATGTELERPAVAEEAQVAKRLEVLVIRAIARTALVECLEEIGDRVRGASVIGGDGGRYEIVVRGEEAHQQGAR